MRYRAITGAIGARGVGAFVALAFAGGACLDSGHLLGTSRGTGGQSATATATGGAASTGGSGVGGMIGSGGVTGTGGASAAGTGGAPATGGALGTGGVAATGGAVGSGGLTASGGAAGSSAGTGGAGGTASVACGGPSGAGCPTGQFCDLASNCGMLDNAPGVCAAFGANVTCSDQQAPVCGCEGRTYVNDCQRAAAGMLKAMDGVCADEIATYPSAYLSWQAAGGASGTEPAVTVNAPDWLRIWDDTPSFAPDSPPANPSATSPLSIYDTDDLFLRLAGVNLSILPFRTPPGSGCRATLYFHLCKGCAANTLTYGASGQLGDSMELVWSWFDARIGSLATNPRNYCSL